MKITNLFLCAFSVLVAACATVPEQRLVLTSKSPTVTSFAEMRVLSVRAEEPLRLSLNAASDVFVFPEGKSFYSALRLPDDTQPRFLAFESPISGIPLYGLRVLIPRFVFLDVNRQLLTTAGSQRLMRKYVLSVGTFISGRVEVPAAAAFAVVYASDKTPAPIMEQNPPGPVRAVEPGPVGETQILVSNQPVAVIADSGFSENGTKAQLFYVAEIDEKRIVNAAYETRVASSGAGLSLTARYTQREVPARPLKLMLVGTHETGAPIHALFSMARGTFFSVEGVIQFTPAGGGDYVVKGELGKASSAVWIEDAVTGRRVTEKIVSASP